MTQSLRADARRNLERVLEAAAEVFAERGPDASVDEIARRAGVGHATVFRRFPTKESLIAAIVGERLRLLEELAAAGADAADPGAAFEAFVWGAAELHNRDRALFEGLERCVGNELVSAKRGTLREHVARLVARAQEQGSLRADVGADDVTSLVRAAIQAGLEAEPDAWRRFVAVVLDGLRPAG